MLHSAFIQAARMSIHNQYRRGFAASSHTFIDKQRAFKSKDAFKQSWLSDPSTYPIFLTLGCALSLSLGTIIYNLTSNPAVQILPSKRGSVIRIVSPHDIK